MAERRAPTPIHDAPARRSRSRSAAGLADGPGAQLRLSESSVHRWQMEAASVIGALRVCRHQLEEAEELIGAQMEMALGACPAGTITEHHLRLALNSLRARSEQLEDGLRTATRLVIVLRDYVHGLRES